jgi:membrane protein YdbS with pleckstrin-like domain
MFSKEVFVSAVVISVLAIISKVIGCGLSTDAIVVFMTAVTTLIAPALLRFLFCDPEISEQPSSAASLVRL